MFLDGLLGDERRKTGWMRAEAAGDAGPWRQQAILGRGRWDADALRDVVRDYVVEHLAADDAVLVIDETGFLKQGKRVLRREPSVHRLRGEDHQLPDRRVRRLCVAPRPCLHRPGAVSAQDLDGRSKGARLHDGAYCERADLDAAEYDDARSGLWTGGLLIRRNIAETWPSSRPGARPEQASKFPRPQVERDTADSDDVAQAFRLDVAHRSDLKSPSVPG